MASGWKIGLALGYGIALSAGHLASLAILDRPVTTDAVEVGAILCIAGTCATLAAALASRILSRRRFTARLAAAIVLMIVGTIAGISLLIGFQMVWSVRGDGLWHIARAIVVGPLIAAYSFLGTVGLLILPPAFLLVLPIAWLLARSPR